MTCSQCGSESSGAYCPTCGAPLLGASCGSCEAPLIAGARFCIECGTAVRESARPGALATVAVVILVLVAALALFLRLGDDRTASNNLPLEPLASDSELTPSAPPLTGTPREQADQLFNRIMQARAQGQTEQVEFFLPMALAAYRQVGELDADGLYHLSVLESEAGELANALSTARRVLDSDPDHLLALGAAARAAVTLGDEVTASSFYERLLSAFEQETERARAEYLDHAPILPEYRSEAEAFLAR